MDSFKTPNERLRDLEQQVASLHAQLRVTGAFGVMMLEQTLEQLVGERLLPVETAWAIWDRLRDQIDGVNAGSSDLAWGARGAMPRRSGIIRKGPAKTHREKLRLRMRKPDTDQ